MQLDDTALELVFKHLPLSEVLRLRHVSTRYRFFSLREVDQRINAPFLYLTKKPGKRLRELFLDALNIWVQAPKDSLTVVKNVTQILHHSSLLVDDIEDRASIRRKQVCAHDVYGVATTLNSANMQYFVALQLLSAHQLDLCPIFTEELINLHRGQGLDILCRDHSENPGRIGYRYIVNNKTSGLFRLSLRLLMALGHEIPGLLGLVNDLGIYFQILDDYLNLTSSEFNYRLPDSAGRGEDFSVFCEDITEGKYSLLVINALASDRLLSEDKQRLTAILALGSHDVSLKAEALHMIRKSGALTQARVTLSDLFNRVQSSYHLIVKNFGPNPAFEHLMDILHDRIPSFPSS